MTPFVPAWHEDGRSDGAPAILVLHGLLGGADNWRSIARALAERLPQWGIVRVDLRNHGSSRPAPPPHDLHQVLRDLDALADAVARPLPAVLGHSLGGKIALMWACHHPGVECAVIVDSPPGRGQPQSATRIDRVIEVVRRVDPAAFRTRQEVAAALAARGLHPRIAAWLTTRIGRRTDGTLAWRFDLDSAVAMLQSYRDTDTWSLVERGCPDGRRPALHFVVGERSDVWRPEDLERLRAVGPPVDVVVAPGAGHWVHADAPQVVVESTARCVARLPGAPSSATNGRTAS